MTNEPATDHYPSILTVDYMNFDDISRLWSITSRNPPELLLAVLIKSFWSGEFTKGDRSAIFLLQNPDDNSSRGRHRPFIPASIKIAQATCIPVLLVVGARPTPAYKKELLPPEVAAWCTKKCSTVFRVEYDEAGRTCLGEVVGHPTRILHFLEWPEEDQQEMYLKWCISHADFAEWYRRSPLSAAVQIERFWPPRGYPTSDQGEPWKDLPLTLGIRRARMAVFPAGVPAGMKLKQQEKLIGDYIVKQGGRRPSPKSFNRERSSLKREKSFRTSSR